MAQAFGAGFLFTVQGSYSKSKAYSDTSQSTHQLPFFEYDTVVEMKLPDHCQLVGIELIDGAVVSTTASVWSQLLLLPHSSVAVQLRVIVSVLPQPGAEASL